MKRLLDHPSKTVILAAGLGTLLGVLYAQFLTGGFKATLALTVDQRPGPKSADFDYDGYYAVKATEAFADTVAAWYATPAFAAEVYQAAGRPLPENMVASAPARFRAKRVSPHMVVVRVSDRDKAASQEIAAAAAQLAATRTAALHTDQDDEPRFGIRASDLVITPNALPLAHGALAGLLAGSFLGLLAVFIGRAPKE